MGKKVDLVITFALLFFLIIILESASIAKDRSHYKVLSKYHKWGIIAGPVLYNKAKLYPQYGDYTFDNKPILGFNVAKSRTTDRAIQY